VSHIEYNRDMARGQFISFRATEGEKRNLAALAAEEGISLSDWVRQAVFAYELDKRVTGGLREAVIILGGQLLPPENCNQIGVIPWQAGDELPGEVILD